MDTANLQALLAASRAGDAAASRDLFAVLYGELKGLARAQLGPGRRKQFLDTTNLVHEAYLRLAPGTGLLAEDRSGLLNLAARVMRNVLIDLVRRDQARKRGAGLRVTWPTGFEPAAAEVLDRIDVLALDRALCALEAESPRLAQLVELRFFGGLEGSEVAELLGLTERTLRRDWRKAQAFLRAMIDADRGP